NRFSASPASDRFCPSRCSRVSRPPHTIACCEWFSAPALAHFSPLPQTHLARTRLTQFSCKYDQPYTHYGPKDCSKPTKRFRALYSRQICFTKVLRFRLPRIV